MALVFEPSFFSAAAVADVASGAGGAAAEDSDDEEYVYVSRLAEQIAAHAMLDEEDDDELYTRPQPVYAQVANVERVGYTQDGDYPVSRYAAVWRDHGPSEWECFYTPPRFQSDVSKQASLFNAQLHYKPKLRGLTSCHSNSPKGIFHSHDPNWPWSPNERKAQQHLYGFSSFRQKESIGTGVFLPKVINSGSHYRRKAGLTSKPSYAPRNKC